jgi:hypothetical protein
VIFFYLSPIPASEKSSGSDPEDVLGLAAANDLRPGDDGVDHRHVRLRVLQVLQVELEVGADAGLKIV